MSRILRHTNRGGAVLIGDQQTDQLAEDNAAGLLAQLFPSVSYVTAPNGARLIPIQEVFSIQQHFAEECERVRKDAHAKGFEAGRQDGLTEARTVLKRFDAAIADAVQERERLLNEARSRVLALVEQVSRKVTFDAIEIDRDATAEMINRIIDQLVDKRRITIKVAPDYLPIVEQHLERFLGQSTAIKELTIEADPRVKSGGCFIETPTGDIDARIESQFDVIHETLSAHEPQP